MVCQKVRKVQKIVNRECRKHKISQLSKYDEREGRSSDLEPTLSNWPHFFTYIKRISLSDKLHPKNQERSIEKQQLQLKNKPEFLQTIIGNLLSGEQLDTIVLVENRQFACNGLILSTHSKYFKKLRRNTEIDLRKTPMKVNIFDFLYKWMVSSVTRIRVKYLVAVMRSAYYLEIPALLQLCFTLLDSDRFKEIAAFDIIHQMRHCHDLMHVNEAISSRLSSCTPIVLCSIQFLSLSEVQICHLLKSSFLAVNSEAEILYSALLWLIEAWPARKSHVLKVLKCIRFAYISPILLCHLNEPEVDNVGPFGCVLREFHRFEEAKQLIQDGIFYSTVVITLNDDSSLLNQTNYIQHKLMIPRRWMSDLRCEYHRSVTIYCPNMRYITYDNFAEYSRILKCSNIRYENYIIYPFDGKLSATTKHKINFSSRRAKKKVESNAALKRKCIQLENSHSAITQTCCLSSLTDFKPSKYWKKLEKVVFREDFK